MGWESCRIYGPSIDVNDISVVNVIILYGAKLVSVCTEYILLFNCPLTKLNWRTWYFSVCLFSLSFTDGVYV